MAAHPTSKSNRWTTSANPATNHGAAAPAHGTCHCLLHPTVNRLRTGTPRSFGIYYIQAMRLILIDI